MRAALLQEPGTPLVVVDPPAAGELVVRITHCGVCHTDLSFVSGTPLEPAAGPAGSRRGRRRRGDRAGSHLACTRRKGGPHQPASLRSLWCVRGEAQLCAQATAMLGGKYPDGGTRLSWRGKPVYRGVVVAGFAERTVVPVAAAVPVPADTPLEIAAVIGCAVMTGIGAVLNTAAVSAGSTVVVVGLGGVGASVVQGARLAGATRIIGVDPVAARREHAQRLGATDLIDPSEVQPHRAAREMTDGIGVDYSFDTVGPGDILESLLRATRNGGTTVMVGLPRAGDVVSVGALAHNLYEKKLIGCYLGSGNAWLEFGRLALWRAGRLDLEDLVSTQRPLEEINAALDDMRAGRGLRTVLTMDGGAGG